MSIGAAPLLSGVLPAQSVLVLLPCCPAKAALFAQLIGFSLCDQAGIIGPTSERRHIVNMERAGNSIRFPRRDLPGCCSGSRPESSDR